MAFGAEKEEEEEEEEEKEEEEGRWMRTCGPAG